MSRRVCWAWSRRLYPDVFAALHGFCERHRGYLDDTVARFDREIQFYLAYLAYIRPIQATGLHLLLPRGFGGVEGGPR